jgi:predicted AlkP superfamily phosphohydrolase/phosphomutase
MHEAALRSLLRRGAWDFMMVVFSVLDRAQHDYWADMDPAHPRHDPKTPREFRQFIHEIYERLDAAVGRLLEQLPAESRVFVVSDHGFCSELFEVRVNELLAAAGLLVFKSPGSRKSLARVREFKGKIARRLGTASNGNSLERKVEYGGAFLSEIDWSRTRAFFAQDKGVWVNLSGRERDGIVRESDFVSVLEEARGALLQLTSPEDNEPIFEQVLRRDEAFNGAWSRRLPDLVMIPRCDEYVYNERPSYGDVIVPADSTTGTHSRDGIFIAWGRGIDKGAAFAAPNLRDVGPTALASLECPLTNDMDGRALMELFSDVTQTTKQGSSYKQTPADGTATRAVYSAEEEAVLRERLRALGYIE